MPQNLMYLNYLFQIDHIGYTNGGTFKQRYLLADQFWNRKGGPIFFYTGNEGDIELFCNNTVSKHGFLLPAEVYASSNQVVSTELSHLIF